MANIVLNGHMKLN